MVKQQPKKDDPADPPKKWEYRSIAVSPELYERVRALGRQMAMTLGRTVVNHEVVEDAVKMLEKRWATR